MQNKCTVFWYYVLNSSSWRWWVTKRLHFGSISAIRVCRIICSEESAAFRIHIFTWNVTICEPKLTRFQASLHLLLYYTTRLEVLSTAAFGQPGNCTWNWPCGLSGLESHIVGMEVNEKSEKKCPLFFSASTTDMFLTHLQGWLVCLQPVATREGQQVMLLLV